MIRAQQAQAGTPTTNNSTTNRNVGDINVSVDMGQNSNPYQVGGIIGSRVHDSILAAQANNGLE